MCDVNNVTLGQAKHPAQILVITYLGWHPEPHKLSGRHLSQSFSFASRQFSNYTNDLFGCQVRIDLVPPQNLGSTQLAFVWA